MSIVAFLFVGLIADVGAMFYFGWGVIGLTGLTIASALVALTAAAMLLAASHAMFRDTRYRRRDPRVKTLATLSCAVAGHQ